MSKRQSMFEWTVATFAAVGLVLTVATAVVFLDVKRRVVNRTLAEISDRSVEAVSDSLAGALWPQVAAPLRDGTSQGFEYADMTIAAFARDAHLLKIKLFDRDGTTIYSPLRRDLGMPTGNPAALAEAANGHSEAVPYRDRTIDSFSGPVNVGSAIAVYAPVRGTGGAIEAVAEIYFDNSAIRTKLESDLASLDRTIVAILAGLYASMLVVVWRTARKNRAHEEALESESAERLDAIGALTLERQRFADFTGIAAGWVWETDADLRITFLSQGVNEIGIDPEREIGASAEQWIGATGEDRDGRSFADMMKARLAFRDVIIGMRRPDDGRPVWIARSAKPIFDKTGAFLGYRGTDRDKTAVIESARKLRLANVAQTGLLDELEKTRERLELALDTAAMGWWELELTTGRQYWSPRAKAIWGFAPDTEPDYAMVLAAIHPDDRASNVNILEAPGSVARRSHRLLLSDGSLRFVREDFRIDRRADGSVARLFATVIDLTDIETLRATAETGKATLDRALDAMADGFALYDADDRLLAANRRFREMLGWSPEIGTHFPEIARINIEKTEPDADPARIEELVAERIRQHRVPDGPFELRFPGGKRYEINESRSANGFTVTTYSDVTQARRDAEELASAKEAAEQASFVKSRFLATMSHEIRTPMNGVLGMLELLVDSSLDERQRGYVEVADRSARGLLSIIDDILDYSRLESGDLRLEYVAFEPAVIARQTVELMAFAARKKGLNLSIEVAPSTSRHVLGDPTRFRQVLLNLIGNAIKFTESGSVSVNLSSVRAAGAVDRLRLAVADTGIGIAPEKMAHLFDHFRQADESISRRFGGSGLGLAISRELARLMGGNLTATSTPGEGSVFELDIPASPPALLPEDSAGNAAAADAAPARALDILVAEDNEINRIVVGEMLERMGHRCTFARDGAEALTAARKHLFDVILMDSEMPVLDGIEATRWIRELPAPHGRVPIVAQTANAMRGDREKYLATGMNDYVAKPIEADLLARALLRATGVASRGVAPAGGARAPSPGSAAARRGLAALATTLRDANVES